MKQKIPVPINCKKPYNKESFNITTQNKFSSYCHARIVCKEITIVTRCLRKIREKEHSCSTVILINTILALVFPIKGELQLQEKRRRK